MEISIIILNYKSEQYLVNCLESLQQHLFGVSHEIILANNDPAPITTILPAENIHIINNQTNAGFATACNKAATTAQGKILFFLNPDTEILSGNLADLVSSLNDPSVGIVSPQLMTTADQVQPWSAGYEITLLEIILNNFGIIRSKKMWQRDTAIEPDWTSGAALAISKTLFEKIGGFDENFFMYFEDVDLCRRVQKNSLKISVLPTIKVLHLSGQSSSSSAQQKKYYYASQDYYFKKHFGLFSLFLLKSLRESILSLKKLVNFPIIHR